jgi:glucokinase
MFLSIEIGGTKLQLGVGHGDGGKLVALERLAVEPKNGAAGIRKQIEEAARPLIERHAVRAIGFGFGGPVDAATGRVIKSHQVTGWDNFPLADWCRETLGLPAVVSNDSDAAGLAEARFGAGRGYRIVFYSNVGSGIGGALVLDGHLYPGSTGIASEIGHLRPGLQSDRPDQTVESLASGWAIAAAAQSLVTDPISHRLGPLVSRGRPRGAESVRQRLIEREEADERAAADLLERCDGRIDRLTTNLLAQAAAQGNELAREVFLQASQAFGWAIAQMITLLAPHVVVIGGGVSLAGEELFLGPLRKAVDCYVFPPLLGTFQIVPAALDEQVVVHGALALAAERVKPPAASR